MGNPLNAIDPNGDSVRVYTEVESNYGAGHSWISHGEGDEMVVYTYGRYGDTKDIPIIPSQLENGDGVLYRFEGEDAKKYNDIKNKEADVSTFVVTDIKDKTVEKNLQSLYDSSTKKPSRDLGTFWTGKGKVIDKYNLIGNNCATFVASHLNKAGSKAMNTVIGTKTYINSPFELGVFLKVKSALGSDSVYKSK